MSRVYKKENLMALTGWSLTVRRYYDYTIPEWLNYCRKKTNHWVNSSFLI